MSEFGYHTIGTAGSDTAGGNVIWAKATSTPATNGTLTTISVHCQGTSSKMFAAIYSDSAGAPNTLIAQAAASVSLPASFGWCDIPVSASIVAGTQYWLAFVHDDGGSSGGIEWKFDSSGGAIEMNFQGGSSFPSPVVAPSTDNTERISIYATYTPSGGGSPQRLALTGAGS